MGRAVVGEPKERTRVAKDERDSTGGAGGDTDHKLVWFIERCLSNAMRLETCIQAAEREGDAALAEFFQRAQGESRKGAEKAKQLLRSRNMGNAAPGG